MTYNPARWARFWRRFLAVQGTILLGVLGLLVWWAIKGSVFYAVLLSIVLVVNSFTLRAGYQVAAHFDQRPEEVWAVILVMVLAMLAMLAIGYLIGWVTHSDRAEHATHAAAHPVTAAGRHAQALPLRLKACPVLPDEWAGSYFPGPPAPAPQPPLGELVRAERVTDFIERLEASTDRWLAAHVEGAR